jgi:hypothetical protein
MELSFKTRLVAKGPKGAWTHMHVPVNAEEAFGKKGQVKVAGTLNGVAFRNSLMPIGDGTHYMNIRKELLAAADVKAGDLVEVTMALDTAKRTVEVPEELKLALAGNAQAAAHFDSLAYSHQKEYTAWIASAKKAETAAARAAKAVEMLTAGKRAR